MTLNTLTIGPARVLIEPGFEIALELQKNSILKNEVITALNEENACRCFGFSKTYTEEKIQRKATELLCKAATEQLFCYSEEPTRQDRTKTTIRHIIPYQVPQRQATIEILASLKDSFLEAYPFCEDKRWFAVYSSRLSLASGDLKVVIQQSISRNEDS